MFSKEQFGQRLREVRKGRHETQQDLANYLHVAKNSISEMEKGTRMTTLEKLVVICQHYNVSADYLLGLTDERRPLREDR